MLQIIIVVFREILEISLIIGILTAVTKNIEGRTKWILSGLVLGFAASTALAFFTDTISTSLDGVGQEIFNGGILFAAATMISWTVIWMQKHAKTISGELKTLSKSISTGRKPLYSLLVLSFLSVLREGSEIVLFTYSAFISGVSTNHIIFGLLVGFLCGITLGVALYFGMLKMFGKYFFLITTWILVFLASGITAQAFGFWVNSDMLPALGNPVWDTSHILLQTSWLGRFCHIFFGYIDKPYGTQIIAYAANLLILTLGLYLAKRHEKI